MKLYDLRAYNQKFMVRRYKANSCFRLPLRSMHVPCAMWIINLLALQGIISYTSQPLLAFLQLLKRPEYFSKFGKIHKIVVNNSTNYAGPQVSQLHSETCKCDQFQMLTPPPPPKCPCLVKQLNLFTEIQTVWIFVLWIFIYWYKR